MKSWTPHTAGEGVAACFAGAPAPGPAACALDAPGNASSGATVVVGVAGDAGAIVADAAHRAKALGARVVLVHAHPASGATGADVERQVAAASALRSAGMQAATELRAGDPAAVLASVAREVGASTIVVGSRRPTWSRRRIGAVGRTLGGTAPCPVVLVPA